ncbi:MAG: Ig-like domain-containing protein, partial [Nevskiaceae bacterium]|nr:Ig-like domain-containing protein [Nevskiaceae bacterium]
MSDAPQSGRDYPLTPPEKDAGESRFVPIAAGQTQATAQADEAEIFTVQARRGDVANFEMQGSDLIINFCDGHKLTIHGFKAAGADADQLVFMDGEVAYWIDFSRALSGADGVADDLVRWFVVEHHTYAGLLALLGAAAAGGLVGALLADDDDKDNTTVVPPPDPGPGPGPRVPDTLGIAGISNDSGISGNDFRTNDNGSDGSLTFYGTSNAANGSVVQVLLDGNVIGTTVVTNGAWSFEYITGTPLADGNYTLSARLPNSTDAPTPSRDFIIDTTASIEINEPVSGDGRISSAERTAVSVSGTVSNVEEGQTVTVTFSDGDPTTPDVTATATVTNVDANGVGSWIVTGVDLNALADGPIGISAAVEDVAGNTASDSAVTMMDALGPDLAIIDPQLIAGNDGVIDAIEQNDVTVSGRVNEVPDGSTVRVTFTDANGLTYSQDAVVINSQWTVTGVDLTAFDDGPVTITASTPDVPGVPPDTTTVTKTTLPPPAPPSAVIQTMSEDTGMSGADNLTNNNQLKFGGPSTAPFVRLVLTAADGSPVSGAEDQYIVPVSNGQWNLDLSDVTLPDGDYRLSVTPAADAAGADIPGATGGERDFTVDTIATVSVNEPLGDNGVISSTARANFSVSGTTTGVEDGQRVQLVFADADGHELRTSAVVSGGAWTVPGVNLTSLTPGSAISVSALVTDKAGNAATDGATANIAAALPTDPDIALNPAGTSIEDGVISASEDDNVTIQGTVDNVPDGSTVTVTFTDSDGNTVSVETQIDGGVWTVDQADLSDLKDGDVTVTASVTEGGTQYQDTQTVQKHTTGPAITPDIKTISVDTGAQGDFTTSQPQQIISGTLTSALQPGDKVQVSLDGGATWNDAGASGTNWVYDATGTPLTTGGNDVRARVVDRYGNAGTEDQQTVTLVDPEPIVAGISAISEDTGESSTDHVTRDTGLVFTGTSNAPFVA